ncbi:MAG: Asp-tRNA(Asn)/Glu-tRNA(Gln) amidotransferase subunit GatB [Ignavibacteria bacterium]
MSSIYEKYEPVIGLEVHAQMKTKTKAFCGCPADFHAPPNSNVCPVCLGHPGVLPVLNKELIDFAIRMGLATKCSIRENTLFARKNYFYPDLSKGYQITQFETPLCYDGLVNIRLKDRSVKRIGITRIHIEEDAGKSIHDFSDNDTLVDFNRCGVPLIEIVSEPDMNSSDEAHRYLYKIRQILVYLGINDGNLEEGSMRCDANISVRLKGDSKLGTRTEIKNLNSFKNVVDAIEAEIKRQADLIEAGEKVSYHTMTYNAKDKTTSHTRSKEEAHDYRYFPEPDLVRLHVSSEQIEKVREILPEPPDERSERFIFQYSLTETEAEEITSEKPLADFFESIVDQLKKKDDKTFKTSANIFRVDVKRVLNEEKIDISTFHLSPAVLANLADSVSEGTISASASREVFTELLAAKDASEQSKLFGELENKYRQVSGESEIEEIVKSVLSENKDEVERYKSGEKKLAGFFVGKVMQASKGKANPKIVNELLIKNLEVKL